MQAVKQEIVLPVAGIIFLSCLGIVIIGHFAEVDFGRIGILAWVVVIVAVIYFVL